MKLNLLEDFATLFFTVKKSNQWQCEFMVSLKKEERQMKRQEDKGREKLQKECFHKDKF